MLEDLFIKKEQRAERLVLSRSSDVAIARQVREEFGDLFFGHIARMAFVVVKNEALDPIHVCLLGPNAVMSAANNVPDLVEQFWFVWFGLGR
jgi:hypothetical protein